MIVFLAMLALSVALGVLFLRSLCPELPGSLTLALGPGVGLGLSSSLFFVSLHVFGQASPLCVLPELGLLAGCVLINTRRREARSELLLRSPPLTWSKLRVFLALLLATLSAMTIIAASYQGLASPHGTFDAPAIWNARGRALALSGQDWPGIFTKGVLFHPDYPLLIPSMNARAWVAMGELAPWIPLIHNSVFYLSFVASFIVSVTLVRDFGMGLFAGVLILSSPVVVEVMLEQLADGPLAFFTLASVVFLILQDRAPERRSLSALAGVAAGCALWTKNEGCLVFLVLIFVRACVLLRNHGLGEMLRQGSRFICASLPFALMLYFFKSQYAPPNDLVSGQSMATLERVCDWGRYQTIFEVLGRRFLYFGGGDFGVLPMLCVAVLFFGRAKEVNKSSIQSLLGLVGFLCAGYFLIYLTTPNSLDWQLKWSIRRIILQLWPLILFLGMLRMRSVTDIEKSLFRGLEDSKEEPGEE